MRILRPQVYGYRSVSSFESCSGHYSVDLLAGMGLQGRQADDYEVLIIT